MDEVLDDKVGVMFCERDLDNSSSSNVLMGIGTVGNDDGPLSIGEAVEVQIPAGRVYEH